MLSTFPVCKSSFKFLFRLSKLVHNFWISSKVKQKCVKQNNTLDLLSVLTRRISVGFKLFEQVSTQRDNSFSS